MKIGIVLLSLAATATGVPPIPQQVMERLADRYRSYRLADVSEQVATWEERTGTSPLWCKGDWDGDEDDDYAVLIQKKDDPRRRIVIAFFRDGEELRDQYAGRGFDGITTLDGIVKLAQADGKVAG